MNVIIFIIITTWWNNPGKSELWFSWHIFEEHLLMVFNIFSFFLFCNLFLKVVYKVMGFVIFSYVYTSLICCYLPPPHNLFLFASSCDPCWFLFLLLIVSTSALKLVFIYLFEMLSIECKLFCLKILFQDSENINYPIFSNRHCNCL